MRFASSRLLTAGVLTGAFALHAACGGSVDLNFVGDSGGAGGTTSGKGGAGSSKGGTNAAGEGSDGGTGNSSNAGADSSGGTDNGGGDAGGGNVSGTAGEGGTGATSGTGGEGGGSNNCVPSSEICDDGVDNDCDDLIDCPVLVGAFPESGKAAAGADVRLSFEDPAPGGVFQCRYGKPNEINSALWFDCSGPDVSPITDADSSDAGQDGLKLFQVRLQFPDGVSSIVGWTAYTHHSLHGELICEREASDDDYFDYAQTLLPAAGAFGAEAKLDNPFINITFEPPVDAQVNVADGDGLVKPLSLRKRFVTNPSNEYLLITRVYESRAYNDYCGVASIFVHDRGMNTGLANARYKPRCTALVLNKKGAGVCLQASGGTISLGYQNNTTWFDVPTYDGDVDALLWRELKRINTGTGRPRYFSPKCSGDPTCVDAAPGLTLYLPDVELFD